MLSPALHSFLCTRQIEIPNSLENWMTNGTGHFCWSLDMHQGQNKWTSMVLSHWDIGGYLLLMHNMIYPNWCSYGKELSNWIFILLKNLRMRVHILFLCLYVNIRQSKRWYAVIKDSTHLNSHVNRCGLIS